MRPSQFALTCRLFALTCRLLGDTIAKGGCFGCQPGRILVLGGQWQAVTHWVLGTLTTGQDSAKLGALTCDPGLTGLNTDLLRSQNLLSPEGVSCCLCFLCTIHVAPVCAGTAPFAL